MYVSPPHPGAVPAQPLRPRSLRAPIVPILSYSWHLSPSRLPSARCADDVAVSQNAPSCSFGLGAERGMYDGGSDTPGPGTYDGAAVQGSCACGGSGPSYSMGGSARHFDYAGPDTPGPGAYSNVALRPCASGGDSPQYSFGTGGPRCAGQCCSDAPGPGAHHPVEAPPVTPSFSFGNSARECGSASGANPGPGTCEQRRRLELSVRPNGVSMLLHRLRALPIQATHLPCRSARLLCMLALTTPPRPAAQTRR